MRGASLIHLQRTESKLANLPMTRWLSCRKHRLNSGEPKKKKESGTRRSKASPWRLIDATSRRAVETRLESAQGTTDAPADATHLWTPLTTIVDMARVDELRLSETKIEDLKDGGRGRHLRSMNPQNNDWLKLSMIFGWTGEFAEPLAFMDTRSRQSARTQRELNWIPRMHVNNLASVTCSRSISSVVPIASSLEEDEPPDATHSLI